MITYYIPGRIGDQDFYARIEGDDVEFIPSEELEVDPFSRVAAPPLKENWADDTRLTTEMRRSFEEAEYAYTRAWPVESEPENEYCAYCESELPAHKASLVPPVDDDEAWEDLARDHLEGCEWILSRAHHFPVVVDPCPDCRGSTSTEVRYDEYRRQWLVYRGGWHPCETCGGRGVVKTVGGDQ